MSQDYIHTFFAIPRLPSPKQQKSTELHNILLKHYLLTITNRIIVILFNKSVDLLLLLIIHLKLNIQCR
jgi:hypothetical protein